MNKDEYSFLGWNDSCSAAIQYFSFPPIGEGTLGDPEKWMIGTITIRPDGYQENKKSQYSSSDHKFWSPRQAIGANEALVRAGYHQDGFQEWIREAPVADQTGLYETIHTTAAFQIGYRTRWPARRFRIEKIHYSPLGTCVLFIFRSMKNPRDSFRFKLTRLDFPGVRRKRARAHVNNGILLYKQSSDLYGAQEELSIAVEMDPEYALAHYYHAVFLANLGRTPEALASLREAITREPRYAKKAKKADEFEHIRHNAIFKSIIAKGKKEQGRRIRYDRANPREGREVPPRIRLDKKAPAKPRHSSMRE